MSTISEKIQQKLPEKESDTSLCLLAASMASFFVTIGLVLMKYAHVKKDTIDPQKQKRPIICNPIWLTGMICMFLGSIFNVIALNIGNQFLVSSTCCLSIIFNAIFSVYFLKERIYPSDYFSLTIIGVGCTLFMVEGKNSNKTYTNEELHQLFTRPNAKMFYMIAISFIVFSFIVEFYVVRQLKRLQKRATMEQN